MASQIDLIEENKNSRYYKCEEIMDNVNYIQHTVTSLQWVNDDTMKSIIKFYKITVKNTVLMTPTKWN